MADHGPPSDGESREQFMSRCIAESDLEGDEAQSACAAAWTESQGGGSEESAKFADDYVDP